MKRSETKRRLFLGVLTAFTLLYLVWRVGFTVPYDHGTLSILFGWVLLAVEILGAAELLIYFFLDTGDAEAVPERKAKPLAVDVFVTACGEPVELLRQTLTACLAMRYGGKFTVYLLDDRPSEEMRSMAESLGVTYLTRKDRTGAKAGNLNAALARTKAPLVAVFDADMCPQPDFLAVTVPYVNGRTAYVQTPQSFRNPDLFQAACGGRNRIPGEQDFFYRAIEPARNRSRAVVLAGSNLLLSRQALREVGGFDTETLTEDFATGIELLKKGWKTAAVAEPHAWGLAPDSFGGLIRQRRRWAAGCIQAGRRTRFLRSKALTVSQKLSYLNGVSYWYFPLKRLVYMTAPLLFALAHVTVMRCTPVSAAAFWLPMFVLTGIGVTVYSRGTRTVGWSMLYETCLSPFLLLTVIRATFGRGSRSFEVTDKSGRGEWKASYLLPFVIGAGINAWGVYAAIVQSLAEGTWLYALLTAWMLYHLYLHVCAFLVVLSCRKKGSGEEVSEEVPPRRRWYLHNKLCLLIAGSLRK